MEEAKKEFSPKVSYKLTYKNNDADTITIFDGKDAIGYIVMNPNDAMCFSALTQLSEDKGKRIDQLTKFNADFYGEFGGKTYTIIPPKYYSDALEAGFPKHPSAGNINNEYKNIRVIRYEKLAEKIVVFADIEKPNLRLIDSSNSEFLKNNAQALLDFMKANAWVEKDSKGNERGFINQGKIDGNLYTLEALKKKLANPNNRFFAVVDKNDSIKACMMVTIFHDKWAYAADLIADKNDEGNGNMKYLCHSAFSTLSKEFTDINVTLIAGGGHDEDTMYENLFGAEALTAETAKELGMIAFLTGRGNEFQAALDRSFDDHMHATQIAVKAIGKFGLMPQPKRVDEDDNVKDLEKGTVAGLN